MRKFFTVIGTCVALTGCGSSSTNTPVTETLASFPNGAGVFRADIVDPNAGSQGNTTKVLAYVPDLSKWVNDFSYSDVTSIANHNIPLLQNNALGSGVDYYYDAGANVTILGENYNFGKETLIILSFGYLIINFFASPIEFLNMSGYVKISVVILILSLIISFDLMINLFFK